MSVSRNFFIQEGHNRNWFIQNKDINLHLILRQQMPARLLACYPEANEGLAIYFDSPQRKDDRLGLSLSSPIQTWSEDGRHGFEISLECELSSLNLVLVSLDSVRALRDLKLGLNHPINLERYRLSGGGPLELQAKQNEQGQVLVQLRRDNDAAGVHLQAQISFDGPLGVSKSGTGLEFQKLDGSKISMTLRFSHNRTLLTPLADASLLKDDFFKTLAVHHAASRSVVAGSGGSSLPSLEMVIAQSSLQNLGFLSYREKVLAGSWRFLTYFGRDTLITLLLLADIAHEDFKHAALRAVLERISGDGQVAHEEDLGFQAVFRHARLESNPEKLNETPVFDYKMVDDDFLLLIAIHTLFADSESLDRWLLSLESEKLLAALLSNLEFVGQKIQKAYLDGQPIAIKDEHIGDWRDSHDGLGGGKYPVSVNLYLIPSCVKAAKRITRHLHDLFGRGFGHKSTAPQQYYAGVGIRFLRDQAEAFLSYWSKIMGLYMLSLSKQELRIRMERWLNLTSLDVANWALQLELGPGLSLSDFIKGADYPPLEGGLRFSALSLLENKQARVIMHSDLCFRLGLEDVPPDELSEHLLLLELPWPLGLATKVGIVVANANLCLESAWCYRLDQNAYHGAVVWSWQHSWLQLGLVRQIRNIKRLQKKAEGVSGEVLTQLSSLLKRLERLKQRLADMEVSAGTLANSELWTWHIQDGEQKAIAFGSAKNNATESNAVQLWSAARLAVLWTRLRDDS